MGESTDYRYRYRGDDVELLSTVGAGCSTCGEPNVSYEYDSVGRIIKTNKLDSQGQTVSSISTKFDDKGRITEVVQTNEQNQATWRKYRYDNTDYPMKPTSITRPSVVEGKISKTTLSYNNAGNVVAMIESGYRPAVPGSQINIAAQTNTPIERTTRFYYTKVNGRDVVTAIDAPQDNEADRAVSQTQYSWDELGENITEIRYPNGLTERFSYQTIAGKTLPTKHTAPDGVATTLSYNTKGLPIAMQRGDQTVRVAYDSMQRPVKWTNQLKQTISASYDDSNQQVTYKLHDGQQIVTQYNTEGQLINRQWLDSKGSVLIDPMAMQYNDMLSRSKATDQIADKETTNQQVRVSTIESTPTTYNPADTLLSSTADATIDIETNLLGKIKQIVLPEGATYNRLYDDFGRMVYAKDANTGESTVAYNLNDQPILIQSATNKHTADYDDNGRVTNTKYCKLGTNLTTITEQSCESITYTYDGAHLSQINDPAQNTDYSYDTQGRLTVESVQFKDSDKSWQTTYQYDETGRLQKVGLPEGATLSYIYNDISNPVKVNYQAPVQGWWQSVIRKVNPNHNSIALMTDIKSDSARGLLAFTHSNGQSASAKYDKAGRLTTWTDGDYQKTLTYDDRNQIIATDSKQNGQEKNEQLSYNAYGELIGVTDNSNNQTTQYQYDGNANRLGFSNSKGQAQYEYKQGTDQLLSISSQAKSANTTNNNGSKNNSIKNDNNSNSNERDSSRSNIKENNNNKQTSTYRYDAAGNPISISTQSISNTQTQRQFTYGARGQLTQLTDNKQISDYRYNHAMQRVSKTTDANTKDKHEQRYLWQQGLLDAEINVKDNQETLTRRYIYVGLRPIAMIDYDVDNNTSIYTVHTDHLGTPQQVSNDKQQTVWQGEYDAFGQVTVKAVPQNNTTDMQAKRKSWLPTLMNSANAAESITNEPVSYTHLTLPTICSV